MEAFESEGEVAGRMLLAWSGRSTQFALDAARIVRVVERGQWDGAPPYDLTTILDLDDEVTPVRVLELDAGASRIGLLAFGVMRLCAVPHDDLLDVPEFVRAHASGRLFRQLAVIDGSPALWVLDVDLINRDATSRRANAPAELFERVDGREGDR